MIQPSRIKALNRRPVVNGRYVLYWMQASPRTRHNHALEYALRQANDRRLPLVVCFVIDDGYPGSTPRSMRFLVQGLITLPKTYRV